MSYRSVLVILQVPSRVSHVDFWRRYFYKLHQIDVDQARKEALMKRADNSRTDSLSWDGKLVGGNWRGGGEIVLENFQSFVYSSSQDLTAPMIGVLPAAFAFYL